MWMMIVNEQILRIVSFFLQSPFNLSYTRLHSHLHLKRILTLMACCTKKEPLSKDTSSYMTGLLFSAVSSPLSKLTDLLILAWPSIKRSTTP
ncbi:protein NCA1 [Trifolium repens]|nr:protein NCA1 [Trifolium repens]